MTGEFTGSSFLSQLKRGGLGGGRGVGPAAATSLLPEPSTQPPQQQLANATAETESTERRATAVRLSAPPMRGVSVSPRRPSELLSALEVDEGDDTQRIDDVLGDAGIGVDGLTDAIEAPPAATEVTSTVAQGAEPLPRTVPGVFGVPQPVLDAPPEELPYFALSASPAEEQIPAPAELVAPQQSSPKGALPNRNWYIWATQEPTRITKDLLNVLLKWAAENKISDTFLQAGKPITGKRHKQLVKMTRRPLDSSELLDLLAMFQGSYVTEIKTGNEVGFRHSFWVSRDERMTFRVAVLGCNSSSGEDGSVEFVFRHIPSDCPTNEDNQVEPEIIKGAYPRDGLVLVVGPTGSGKSTLLAGLLRHCLTWDKPEGGKRVLTFESPIEFNLVTIPDQTGLVRQSDVPTHVKTFADGIKNALRSKPDYILIGETRDKETTEGIIRAAETGHTVYSTVHSKGVVNTLARLADEYPPSERWGVQVKLIDNIRLIVYQTLVQSTDPTGRPCALREWLVFTDAIRLKLRRAGPDGFYDVLEAALQAEGMPMKRYAERMHAKGRIGDSILASLSEL